MRVYAEVVTYNEADRYLVPCLNWLLGIVDAVHVYDDRSSDDTADIADGLGADVTVRPATATPFSENEAQFRETAWLDLEARFAPSTDDWILAIDADQFMVSDGGSIEDERAALIENIASAGQGTDGFHVPIPEVFGFAEDGTPLIRTDGYWGLIDGLRLVRYKPNPSFANRKGRHVTLGGDSVPSNIRSYVAANHISILHYGYADESERQRRHDRYAGRPGHSAVHVRSILEPGRLERWTGKTPNLVSR